MTVVKGRGIVAQPKSLILTVLFLEIFLGVPTTTRFVGAKNKKIHRFFDDSYDSFLDLPEESATAATLPSTKSTLAPKNDEGRVEKVHEERVEKVHEANSGKVHESVASSEESKESGKSSSSKILQQESEKSREIDPCLGIRCRIGRVCRANDAFSGAWCVCADANHCVTHGRGRERGRRVCGSDGLFYSSHCEMHRMACVSNQPIRVNHNESACLLLRRSTNHHNVHLQQQQQPATDGDSAQPLPTKSKVLSEHDKSSRMTSVATESDKTALTSIGHCTQVEYGKFVEALLQADCTRTGNRNCAASSNRHLQSIYDIMFSYFDNDSDLRLDVFELDDAESRDHSLSALTTTCHLQDLVRFGDKDLDLTLTLAEFYEALKVSSVVLDESLKVFLTSATVGTGLELKCDIGGTTDYVWKRNGHNVGGNGGASSDSTDKIKVFDDGSLYISDISLYHVGNYSCQDRLNDDVIQMHIVTVHVPPIVRVSPKTRFAASGATVTIRCHVEGVPVPVVSWSANEMPLSGPGLDRYTLLHDGLTLQIRDADYLVDTGTFKCRANNDIGSSEDLATVFVENPDTLHSASSDELNQLFVAFYDEGFGVYEPGHCHIHHVVKADFKVASRGDRANGLQQQPLNPLCESNTTCVWGGAVNVKNRFIYATQPELNRVVVVEVRDRFNPIEVIPTDVSPVEISYVEHLDQVWVSCRDSRRGLGASSSSSSDASASAAAGSSSTTLIVIQRASADVRHRIVHTQPVTDNFDVVKQLFLAPSNVFQQTSDYGYVVREGGGEGGRGGRRLSLHKIDLNSLKYVKRLDDVDETGGCIPSRLAFIPLAGMIFANCAQTSTSDAQVVSNVSSSEGCFTLDYVTDKGASVDPAALVTSVCGDPYVSPDSRHLVIIKDNRRALRVYRIDDDGSMDLEYDEIVDMRIGDVTFFATEKGYDLFAKAIDQSAILSMNLASGRMETIKEGLGHSQSGNDNRSLPSNGGGRFLPIVSGGVFSDYLMTPSTDALYVIDAIRRHIQCEWQDVGHATVITWVQVSNR